MPTDALISSKGRARIDGFPLLRILPGRDYLPEMLKPNVPRGIRSSYIEILSTYGLFKTPFEEPTPSCAD